MSTEAKKSGVVVLVGRSNVGKSTLLNSLVGSKVAITTPKPQTTRQTIQGVLSDDRGQIVFVDTPGIFKRVPDTLTAKLNEMARESMTGVDVLVYVVDPTRHIGEEERLMRRLVDRSEAPKILVINKSDQRGSYKEEYLEWSADFDRTIEVSALRGGNLKALVSALFELLPEGEPHYPPGQMTNVDHRFWLSELIREKTFLATHEELPYTTAVEIEEMAERPDGLYYVKAAVITNSQRYKRMLVGSGGRMIRRIGSTARKEMEAVMGRKVYLDLEVRVDERWQERFE